LVLYLCWVLVLVGLVRGCVGVVYWLLSVAIGLWVSPADEERDDEDRTEKQKKENAPVPPRGGVDRHADVLDVAKGEEGGVEGGLGDAVVEAAHVDDALGVADLHERRRHFVDLVVSLGAAGAPPPLPTPTPTPPTLLFTLAPAGCCLSPWAATACWSCSSVSCCRWRQE
jgi:hypothetical protein